MSAFHNIVLKENAGASVDCIRRMLLSAIENTPQFSGRTPTDNEFVAFAIGIRCAQMMYRAKHPGELFHGLTLPDGYVAEIIVSPAN